MTKNINELLDEVNNNMVNIAKYKDNHFLVDVLRYAFDENMKWNLPEGVPPHKEEDIPDGMAVTNFYKEIRRFYVFLSPTLPAIKRENIFIEMLEGLSANEREILILIKEQKLTNKYPNITKEAVSCLIFK